MHAPRAILFDLDDTILDTTDSASRVWRMTARHFADRIGMPPEHIDTVLDRSRVWYWADPERNQAGRLNLHQARRDVTVHGFNALGIDDTDLAHRFADHYSDHRVGEMQPFPGAIETIEHFHDAGMPMALLTNGKGQTQRDKVTAFDLERYFRVVLIEGEIGYGKPNPRVFARALEACGNVPATAAWCVGDNLEWEVAAPQALGMAGIWCDWEGVSLPTDSPVKPDRIVRRIAELIDMVD